MKQHRIESLDIAKGLGIILVVIGHFINMYSYPGRVIYSFHMPLFFFLSGICFNEQKYNDVSSVAVNRSRTLLWPCICFTIIISILQTLLIDIPLSSLSKELSGALWFLPILFIADFLYSLICRAALPARIVVLLLVYVCGIIWHDSIAELPYKLSYFPKAILYYGLGHTFRNNILSRLNAIRNWKFIHCILLTLLFTTIVFVAELRTYSEHSIIDGIYKPLIAFSGISATMCFASSIHNKMKDVILYLGRNTLVIMAVHVFFLRLCVYYVEPNINSHIVYKSTEFSFVWIATLLSVMCVNRYVKWIKRI